MTSGAKSEPTTGMVGKAIAGRYGIREPLGGSLGDVYKTDNMQIEPFVAPKFEMNDSSRSSRMNKR
jgi:hypothetical protein